MDVISIIAYFSFFLGLFISINYLMHYLKPEEEKKVEIKEWPKIAIIVPAYNEEKNVEDTLTSLSSLNYPKDKLKIVFVDDGSKDNTYKKALEVAERLNKKYGINLIEVYTKKKRRKSKHLKFRNKKSCR
jgi:hyaluronan synthase